MDDSADFRAKVGELLSLIYSHEGHFRSLPQQAPRQMAAAGLMRCCALVRGVQTLEDAGLGVIAGILERAHWETWLVSLHIVLRGDDALHEIAGDDIYYKRILSKKFDLGNYHEDWEKTVGRVEKLNINNLAAALKALLIAAGEPGNPDGVAGYDVTFRVQALFAVHAGLRSLSSFLEYGESEWSTVAHPAQEFCLVAGHQVTDSSQGFADCGTKPSRRSS